MADRIKLRRGPKNKIDLNVYELGYVTDSNEERLYFNNGSMVPIPNNKDITDIKTELTETTNVSNKNKQDVSELKESIAGIIKTGVAKLVQYSYDIELIENTKKVNIPYERYSSVTDTLKVYVNGLAIQNDQYTITDPVENDGIVTNGYIVLKVERPAGTIVRLEVWKNVPSGEEGEVNGNIIAQNSLPLDRIIGINDIRNNPNLLINGDFKINQRNQQTYTKDSSYTVDRWMLINKGVDEVPHGSLSKKDKGISLTGAKSRQLYIEQRIDELNASTLLGKTVTLSCEMLGNNINQGNVFLQIYYYNSNLEIASHKKIIDHTELKTNWNKYYFTTSIPENVQKIGAQIGTYNNPIDGYNMINEDGELFINNVKLELGSVATPFVPRLYSEELDLCQRYYCRAKISQNLIASDDKQIMVNIITPKIMRINPTAIYDSDIYFHNLSDGNPILIGHKGDNPHSIDEYTNDRNIKLWLCNSSSATQITDGMCGVINSSDTTNNRLTASAWIIFDAEIY